MLTEWNFVHKSILSFVTSLDTLCFIVFTLSLDFTSKSKKQIFVVHRNSCGFQRKLANTVILLRNTCGNCLLWMVKTICPVITELVNTDIYFYQATDEIGYFFFAMFIELVNTVWWILLFILQYCLVSYSAKTIMIANVIEFPKFYIWASAQLCMIHNDEMYLFFTKCIFLDIVNCGNFGLNHEYFKSITKKSFWKSE